MPAARGAAQASPADVPCGLVIDAGGLRPSTTYGLGMFTTGSPVTLGYLTSNAVGSITNGDVMYQPVNAPVQIYSNAVAEQRCSPCTHDGQDCWPWTISLPSIGKAVIEGQVSRPAGDGHGRSPVRCGRCTLLLHIVVGRWPAGTSGGLPRWARASSELTGVRSTSMCSRLVAV